MARLPGAFLMETIAQRKTLPSSRAEGAKGKLETEKENGDQTLTAESFLSVGN